MKQKSVLIIDPAVNEPAVSCINRLIEMYPHIRFSFHLPAIVGLKTISSEEHFDAIIILGSAAFVSEQSGWKSKTFEFIKNSLENKTPVLGICFGLQLVVQGFGGLVDFVSLDQHKQLGLRTVTFGEHFEGIKIGEEFNFAVNHRQEIKVLPNCFQIVASSKTVATEVVQHRTLPFFGIQAHPEASVFFMSEYIGGMSPDQMATAQQSGNRFINEFFKFANVEVTQ